jgi:DnaJ-class molecular chaperone
MTIPPDEMCKTCKGTGMTATDMTSTKSRLCFDCHGTGKKSKLIPKH